VLNTYVLQEERARPRMRWTCRCCAWPLTRSCSVIAVTSYVGVAIAALIIVVVLQPSLLNDAGSAISNVGDIILSRAKPSPPKPSLRNNFTESELEDRLQHRFGKLFRLGTRAPTYFEACLDDQGGTQSPFPMSGAVPPRRPFYDIVGMETVKPCPKIVRRSDVNMTEAKLLFIGVFTVPRNVELRAAIRNSFKRWPNETLRHVSVYFVFGQPWTSEEARQIDEEKLQFGDILMTPSRENMNKGKTFEFFAVASELHPPHVHYLKSDDDTFIVLPNLMAKFSTFSRRDAVYYGFQCAPEPFFCGMCYSFSRALLALIPRPPYDLLREFPEDNLAERWIYYHLDQKRVPVTRFDDRGGFFDWPEAPSDEELARALIPGDRVVAIHPLKTVAKFTTVARFFQP